MRRIIKHNKAQGISLNVVVVAAIALLVLVILAVVVIQRMGVFNQSVGSCQANQGRCLEVCGGEFNLAAPQYTCDEGLAGEQLYCCIRGGSIVD